MTTTRYVKHSKRTNRKPCPGCGSTELYQAHDTQDRTHGGRAYCPDCKCSGKLVYVDRAGKRHACAADKPDDKGPFDPSAWFSGEIDMDGGQPISLGDRTVTITGGGGGGGAGRLPRGSLFFDEAVEFTRDKITGELTITGIKPAAPKAIEPVKEPETVSTDPDAAIAALRTLLSPDIDRATVEKIAREVIADVVYPTRTVVIKDAVKKEIDGSTHRQLGDVIAAVSSGEHVMMVGPAGTGKSHIAGQAAEAVGLASYSISLSPQTPASALLGYMQAAGEYVETLFRKAYETGGLFHFDEVDNAHPSVLAVVNSALANGHMAFPDKMVARHDDFRVVASANTYGRGATRQYVGRQQLDAATLDRFTIITIDIDEALENALTHATGAAKSTVTKVLKYVRGLRQNAESNGLNVVLSPRASVGMCRLLHAGMNWDQAVDARIKRGIDKAAWEKLSKGVTA